MLKLELLFVVSDQIAVFLFSEIQIFLVATNNLLYYYSNVYTLLLLLWSVDQIIIIMIYDNNKQGARFTCPLLYPNRLSVLAMQKADRFRRLGDSQK